MSRAEYLAELESRHQALQAEIVEASTHLSTDNLQLVALKRRKLLVKDEIARLHASIRKWLIRCCRRCSCRLLSVVTSFHVPRGFVKRIMRDP